MKNGYRLPDIPDIASVPLEDIKMILPSPTFSGTKRQQQVCKFDLNFSRLCLREFSFFQVLFVIRMLLFLCMFLFLKLVLLYLCLILFRSKFTLSC